MLDLFNQILGIWSGLPTNPEYLDLVRGTDFYAPQAVAAALEVILVVAGFRPAMLIDAADFHPTSLYGPVGRHWMLPLVNSLLTIMPSYMSYYADFNVSDEIDQVGPGIYLFNSKLISVEQVKSESPGKILGYPCAGEQGGTFGITLYALSEDDRRVELISQTCKEFLSKMPRFADQITKLDHIFRSTNLPFKNPGLDIIKYTETT